MQEKELKRVKTLALKLNKIYRKAQEQETAPEKISATAARKNLPAWVSSGNLAKVGENQ